MQPIVSPNEFIHGNNQTRSYNNDTSCVPLIINSYLTLHRYRQNQTRMRSQKRVQLACLILQIGNTAQRCNIREKNMPFACKLFAVCISCNSCLLFFGFKFSLAIYVCLLFIARAGTRFLGGFVSVFFLLFTGKYLLYF